MIELTYTYRCFICPAQQVETLEVVPGQQLPTVGLPRGWSHSYGMTTCLACNRYVQAAAKALELQRTLTEAGPVV